MTNSEVVWCGLKPARMFSTKRPVLAQPVSRSWANASQQAQPVIFSDNLDAAGGSAEERSWQALLVQTATLSMVGDEPHTDARQANRDGSTTRKFWGCVCCLTSPPRRPISAPAAMPLTPLSRLCETCRTLETARRHS